VVLAGARRRVIGVGVPLWAVLILLGSFLIAPCLPSPDLASLSCSLWLSRILLSSSVRTVLPSLSTILSKFGLLTKYLFECSEA